MRITLWTVWAACAAWSGPALAQDETPPGEEFRAYRAPEFGRYLQERGLGTDRFRLNGSLRTEQWFDDNLFLTADGEEDDFVSVFVADVRGRLEYERVQATLAYEAREYLYADHDDFNGLEHDADGRLRLKPGRVEIELYDTYAFRKQAANATLFRERVDRRQNDVGAIARLNAHRFDLEVRGQARRFEVDEAGFEDFNHARRDVSALGALDVADQLQALAELGTSDTEFDEAALGDFGIVWAAAGFRGKPSGKLTASVKVGWVSVEQSEGADDADLMVQAMVVWRVSIPTILQARLDRVPVESITSGWALHTRLSVSLSQWFHERVTGRLFVYWEQAEEGDGEGDRDGYGADAGLRCELGTNWVAEAWVGFRTARSDSGAYDFDNNRGYVGVAFEF